MYESLVPPIRDYRDPVNSPSRYTDVSKGSVQQFLGDLPIGWLIAGGLIGASYLQSKRGR